MSDYVEVPRCGFHTGIKILSGDTGETIVVDDYIANLEAENAAMKEELDRYKDALERILEVYKDPDSFGFHSDGYYLAKAALSATGEDE